MEKQQQRKNKQQGSQRPYKNKNISKKPYKPKEQNVTHKSATDTVPKAKGNEQLPEIKDMLEIPTQRRLEKTVQYFKKVRPFLEAFMQKKIGSRVVQLMFKWGSKEVKQQINKVILSSWKDLTKSKYALHSIATVLSEYDFPKIIDDAILLQNNKQGSMLLQGYIAKQPNAAVGIIKKFDDIEKLAGQKGLQSQQPLHNLAMKSIEKGYYSNRISKHIIKLALPTMVEEEREKVLEFFSDKLFQLFTDDEGVKLFIYLYNYCDSKAKKTIIKQLDGKVNQLIHMCKISYVALIKIITETDDTVVVGNKIIPQLLQLLVQPSTEMQDENKVQKQNGQQGQNNQPKNHRLLNVIVSLLCPRNNNFNCLGKFESSVAFTTCKKPEQTRKQQIREFMYPTLVEYITSQQNINKMITDLHLSKIPLGVLKSMQSDSSGSLKDYSTKMLKYFLVDLDSLKVQNSKKVKISQSLTANNFGSKLLKNILLLQQAYIDKYCDKFAEIFKANLEQTLHSNASFVLTILIEKGRDQLIDEIKKSKIDISKAKAANFYMGRMKGKSK